MKLDPARWERVQAVFHAAADLPAAEQAAFLTAECAGDPELRRHVEALLAEDAGRGSVLDAGLAGAAGAVLGDSRSALPAGDFGPYRLKSVLGEGGMGVVYLAERSNVGGVAALKILRDASLSPARRERFANEQRTLAQLHHPAIAQLYDAGTLPDGTPWFVMEYVEGVPLTTYCRERATSVRGRLLLVRSVCEAVQHAHRHAVIHRDLKPSNVLVTPDGTVKLLDFGIAKQLESLDLPVDQTRTGLRLLTPAYAAPEQIRGDRVGIYTDVYALGVVLYELLAGRLPFDLSGKTPAEALAIVADQEPPRPSIAAPAQPGAGAIGRAAWADLDVLCVTAMHKDPHRRYRTVEALIRDIDHFLDGEPLEARPDTLGYRLGKFVARNRGPVIAGTAAFALVVGLVVYYTVRLANARNAAVAEAGRTQRIQRFMLSLFQGDREAGPPDTLRVVSLIGRGVQEAASLEAEPAVQAELYQTLGGLYRALGDLPRADTLLRRALDQRRLLHGPEHPDVAASLLALGELRADEAKYDEAGRLARDGLSLARRTHPAGHPAVAEAATTLGRVLQERGRYDSAIAVLEEAVAIRSAASGAPADLAGSVYELANAHFYAGHYPVADSLNRRALELHRRLYGERHPTIAEDLVNLGAVQAELGQYAGAERYYRQALEITRAWYGESHYKTAAGRTMLGRSLQYQERHDEAAAELEHALAIRERVFGPVHPSVASTINELATIALARNRLDEAEALFTRMIGIYRQTVGERHSLMAVATSNLASVLGARGEFARAEALYREALAGFTAAVGTDHTNTGIAHIKLGRALLRQRKFREAAEESWIGYQTLVRAGDQGTSFLRAARTDLAAAYDTLGQPDRAARFKAELADTARRTAGSSP